MKARSTLSSVEISFLTHVTEDPVRVVKIVSKIFWVAEDLFEPSSLMGHFGNPIVKYRARLLGDDADRFTDRLADLLDPAEKAVLISEISKHIDEHGDLYLRIDKQSFFTGRVTQSQVDALRIRFKPRFRRSPSETIDVYLKLFKVV